MRKLIYLDTAIDAVLKESNIDDAYGYMDTKSIVDLLNDLPSAQPEPSNDDIGCSNCMYSGRPIYKSPCSECHNNSQWEMKPISRSHENGIECEDVVSRQKLLNDLEELIAAWEKYPVMAEQIKGVETAIGYVKTIPSVAPKRKTGKWIEEKRGIKVTQYKCSECGRTVMDDTGYDVTKDYPFCHCGADMNGSE